MKVLGVDWGTSSLRVYQIDEKGTASESRSSDLGLKNAAKSGFAKALRETAGDLLDQTDIVVMSGMVGAKEGWRQAPYCNSPCGVAEICSKMVQVDDEKDLNIWIAPGVCYEANGNIDVMRGEETQILGAMASGDKSDGVYVLPGTHTKWIQVQDQKITIFSTFMTGDVYAALCAKTVLGLQINENDSFDINAFEKGVHVGTSTKSGGELLSVLFSTRTSGLFEKIPPQGLASYLSGMLIGSEISAAKQIYACSQVTLVVNEMLNERYEMALSIEKIKAKSISAKVVTHGQLSLAKHILQR